MDLLQSNWDSVLTLLRTSHPAWLLGAMALLPLAGMPVSPLMILAGVRFGPLWGFVAASATLAINISAAYWIAQFGLEPWVRRWIERRRFSLASLKDLSEWKVVLLCRVTPGIPLVLQNYGLGCTRVRFRPYFAISLPVVSLYALGFVVFGDSLARSSLWHVAMGLSFLVALLLVVSLGRKWVVRRLQAE